MLNFASRAVTDHPWLTTCLLALGALTFVKFAAKALGVFLQTFILPGKNVSDPWQLGLIL